MWRVLGTAVAALLMATSAQAATRHHHASHRHYASSTAKARLRPARATVRNVQDVAPAPAVQPAAGPAAPPVAPAAPTDGSLSTEQLTQAVSGTSVIAGQDPNCDSAAAAAGCAAVSSVVGKPAHNEATELYAGYQQSVPAANTAAERAAQAMPKFQVSTSPGATTVLP